MFPAWASGDRRGVEDPAKLIRSVGRRIAELRRQARLTQEELAEQLDVGSRYVSRAERGENLTLDTLARFANVLGVRARELLDPPRPESRKVRTGRPRKVK